MTTPTETPTVTVGELEAMTSGEVACAVEVCEVEATWRVVVPCGHSWVWCDGHVTETRAAISQALGRPWVEDWGHDACGSRWAPNLIRFEAI